MRQQLAELKKQVDRLENRDVEVLDMVDEVYGIFAWILDPDGIKIERWEQVLSPD